MSESVTYSVYTNEKIKIYPGDRNINVSKLIFKARGETLDIKMQKGGNMKMYCVLAAKMRKNQGMKSLDVNIWERKMKSYLTACFSVKMWMIWF